MYYCVIVAFCQHVLNEHAITVVAMNAVRGARVTLNDVPLFCSCAGVSARH